MTEIAGASAGFRNSACSCFARVRGLDRRSQELKKRAGLRCEVLARGIVGIQGETLLLPIRKEDHQSSTREMGVHAEFENLSDPISCQAHSVHCCDVAQHELVFRLNPDLVTTGMRLRRRSPVSLACSQ